MVAEMQGAAGVVINAPAPAETIETTMLMVDIPVIATVTEDDEIILLGDIVGGSPLTNAIEQVSNKGLIGQTVIFGGMNLAMALTATLMKDGVDTDMLKDSLINEAKDAVKEFVMTSANDDEEDDI